MVYGFLTASIAIIALIDKINSLCPEVIDFGTDVATKPEKCPEYYQEYPKMIGELAFPTLIVTGD